MEPTRLPAITDPDGDGIPGVAFDVTGFVTGIRNSAQRVWQEYATASNSVAPASAINVVVPPARSTSKSTRDARHGLR